MSASSSVFFQALALIIFLMTILWIASVMLRNASIVDIFWGPGFVLTASLYFAQTYGLPVRKGLVLTLVSLWGIRLGIFLAWRNRGKGEDFRYREFRRQYGTGRYWWISFFQVFLLQGILMWLISAPLLGAQMSSGGEALNWMDGLGLVFWLTGFVFEAGSDLQLARFKSTPGNKGKLLTTGFWRYTRHPNYFGDAAVWWGFGLFSLAAGNYVAVLGSLLMTGLLLRVSGVTLLERSLSKTKPGYAEYARRTSAFFPWFPRGEQDQRSGT